MSLHACSMALLQALLALSASPCAAARTLHVGGIPPSAADSSDRFRTPEEALRAVSLLRAHGRTAEPITIALHGRHTVTEPLVLRPEHSHLSIVAVPPPSASTGSISSISGGLIVEGWKPLSTGSSVWVAAVPPGLPASRQLYVDGTRANRTKLWWPGAAKSWHVAGSSLTAHAGADVDVLHSLTNSPQSSMELVWTGGCKEKAKHCAPGQHSYREARCPVASITPANGGSGVNVTVVEPCFSRAKLSTCSIPSYVSNSRSQLDENAPPGTFFFDRASDRLIYRAAVGWVPEQSEVVLPVAETLMRITPGTHHVSFVGIAFECEPSVNHSLSIALIAA